MNKKTYELLDVEKVEIATSHFKRKYVIEEMGISNTTATLMLNHGVLPPRDNVRNKALNGLSKLTGLNVSDLIMQLSRVSNL